MFYWVVGMKVNCLVGSGWFSIYIYFEACLVACLFKSRKFMELWVSCVGLSFMLSGIWFMCLLMIWGWIFVMSYMIKISSTYLV